MRPTVGEPTSVVFTASWVLQREESYGDVVGFYHTHPSGFDLPSERDHRTMRAWVSAFGKPLLCLIEADRKVRANLYMDDTGQGTALADCELLPRGVVLVYDDREEQHGR